MPRWNPNGQINRILRRAIAFFVSASALWILTSATQPERSTDLISGLGENPAFIAGLLRAELGPPPAGAHLLSGMNWWQTMVLAEVPLLREREASVRDYLSGGAPAGPVVADLQPPTQDVLIREEPLHTAREEDDDEPEILSGAQGETQIIPRTLSPGASSAWLEAGGTYVYNQSGLSIDLAALAAEQITVELGDEAPAVLIYHTHGSESYARSAGDAYVETDTARTNNERYNVVRVGDELAATLKAFGISVIHDRTLYDYPYYNGAYARSLEGVNAYMEKYPSIRVALDLHRDALEGDGVIYKPVADIDGQTAAQVLLVVGTQAGGQEHLNWKENLKFALAVQRRLDSLYPTLARPIALRSPRYNQQILPGALLIEMGSHGNTLEEALLSARLLGIALSEVLVPAG